MLHQEFKVLDHGYIKLIETWGSDERIIEAARMSTGKGFLGWGPVHTPECAYTKAQEYMNENPGNWCTDKCNCVTKPGDEKLLKFLYDNHHATPFEMAGMIIEVQAPIFVFREWHRHRTQSYNEMSARYTPLPDLNYIPTVERLMINSKSNKQAGVVPGAQELTEEGAEAFREGLAQSYKASQELYEAALRGGIPKELARVHLPVGRYSRMRASTNLRNWLGFMTLRSTLKNPAAQWEIRQFADVVGDLVGEAFPRTSGLYIGSK